MTPQTILIPTDFSPDAAAALVHALALAKLYKARLLIVFVKPSSVLPHALDDVDDPEEQEMHKELEAFIPPEPGVPCEHRFLRGNPPDSILRFAEEHDADLIVMGTHGLTNAVDQAVGSIAQAVIARAKTPVICAHVPRGE
jgi:nucleotide-binding universal stress UspA family protein